MKEKLVSVCIPVYNGEKYISKTLDSIINQTYKNIEIIVSDNCSTDNTCKIVEEYANQDNRISLNKNEKNLGFSGNLNKLIELSSSEYVAIYHADDVYEKKIVEEEINFLIKNPECAGAFTLGEVIDENGKKKKNIFPLNKHNTKYNIIANLDMFIKILTEKNNIFICPTSMIKKSVYLELGGYNQNIKMIEDQDMWLRILQKYKIGIIAKSLINYRQHSMQGSSYYSNPDREEVSFSVLNLEKFLNENKLQEIYKRELNKMYAKEYCILTLNKLIAGNRKKCINFAEKSKKFYKYEIYNKKWILQNISLPFLFELLRLKYHKR